jgi:hypothetical protein
MNVDLPALFQSLSLPYHPRPGIIKADPPEILATEASLSDALAAFGGTGWICYADGLRSGVAASPLATDLGPVLSAEFCNGPDSLHVRMEGSGWHALRLHAGASDSAWIIDHQFLSSPAAHGKKLAYEVCWLLDSSRQPAAFTPALFRFTGFLD